MSGLFTIKLNALGNAGKVLWSAWYDVAYPLHEDKILVMHVSAGLTRDGQRPPPITGCSDLAYASATPVTNNEPDVPKEQPAVSGDWTYILRSKGKISEATSQTVDGANIMVTCGEKSWVAGIRMADGSYPEWIVRKEKLWFYLNNGKKAVTSLVPTYHLIDEMRVGAGRTFAMGVAREFKSARSEIVVAVTENGNETFKYKRTFSARGSTKAIDAIMSHCGR